MTKPATVAEAMRALSETFSLPEAQPVAVKVVQDKLTHAELGGLLLTLLIQWPIRALAVWGVLAVFFPAFGLTYVAVLFALWAITHAVPPRVEGMVKGIIARRK